MGNIQTVGPNEALVVSGGCCRPSRREVIVGGWCWNTWMLTNIQRISLQVMTVNARCEQVQSRHGVPVTVSCVVHCKIMSGPEFLPVAAEQFLGKSTEQIKTVVLQTVEGHLRAVIGTQTLEDISKKRSEVAHLVRQAATEDLARMSIDIMSLTIKEITDNVQYLESVGKRTAALVTRDAAVEEARAKSDAAQVLAECQREIKERELKNQSKLATLEHGNIMAKAEYNEKIGRITAEAAKAYDLQLACLQKDIRSIEMEVTAIEYEGLIKIQKKENERRKTELEMEVDLPTRAEIYELGKQCEADAAEQEARIEAEEYAIEVEGKALAEAALTEGKAEAEGLKLVAEARKEFNEAAVLYEVLKVLPEVAAEVASPLAKFDEIVLISDGQTQQSGAKDRNDRNALASSATKSSIGLAAEAAKLTSSLPLAVRAVGGTDSTGSSLLNSILQLQKSAS